MANPDLHTLPTFVDSISFLYTEHCSIDQHQHEITMHDADGEITIPIATLNTLMLGPGTRITHSAVAAITESGSSLIWTGADGHRCYAHGVGRSRSTRNLHRQARAWADDKLHLEVVYRMYELRFREVLPRSLTLRQIRGKEGSRVRRAYQEAGALYGIDWNGRQFTRGDWYAADPPNRALSAGASCLYGLCHNAVVSAGYSPGLGFIHTGKQLSFIYDVADIYKAEILFPAAFRSAAENPDEVEKAVRRNLREAIKPAHLMDRIINDLHFLFQGLTIDDISDQENEAFESDEVSSLWDSSGTPIEGGVNYGGDDGGERPAETEG